MFVPGEALLSSAMQHDAALLEFSMAKGIMLASPLSLIALLKAIAYGWQQDTVAKNAQEISDLGRHLYDRIAKLAEHFENVGRSLAKAVQAYNGAVGTLESRVLVTARRLKDKGVTVSEEFRELEPVDQTPRLLGAPELVGLFDDATVDAEIVAEAAGVASARSGKRAQPSSDRRGQRHHRADGEIAGCYRRIRHRRLRRHRALHHHRPRLGHRHAVVLDADDPLDPHSGAACRRFGSRTRILNRHPQRFALRFGAFLDVESQASHRGRAGADRSGDDLADPCRSHRHALQSCCARRNRAASAVRWRSRTPGADPPSRADRITAERQARSLCMTAFIASTLARCASFGSRARDSALIVTHARSAARLTSASPEVTTTGKSSLASCASAGTPISRNATAMTATDRTTTSSSEVSHCQRPTTNSQSQINW